MLALAVNRSSRRALAITRRRQRRTKHQNRPLTHILTRQQQLQLAAPATAAARCDPVD